MMLFNDTRRRNVMIVTIVLLLVVILIGGLKFFYQVYDKQFSAASQLEAVEDVRSIPGGMKQPSSKEYTKLQKQQNTQQAKQAKKTGRSAIATIVDGFQIEPSEEQPMPPSLDSPLPHSDATVLPYSPAQPALPSLGQESEIHAVLARQNALLSEQKAEILKQQMQNAMNQQINQLFGTWGNFPTQQAVVGIEKHEPKSLALKTDQQKVSGTSTSLVKAGTIIHAVLLTAVNSDEPGPVLAKVVAGELQGARLIGTLSNLGERLLIQFNTVNLAHASHTFKINAIGVDESTARTALSSYTDRHFMLRYGSLFAALFLEGYGLAFQQSGMRTLSDDSYGSGAQVNGNQRNHMGSGVIWPALDLKGKTFVALGNVGARFSTLLANQVHRAPTVHIHAGTGIGILFMADLPALSPPYKVNSDG